MFFCRAFSQFRDVTDFQVLNDNHCVFFIDSRGGLVKVAFAYAGDIRVQTLELCQLAKACFKTVGLTVAFFIYPMTSRSL